MHATCPSARSRPAFVLLALLGVATAAHAIDVPLHGDRLVVRRQSNGKERLTFVASGGTVVLPIPGSAADPATSSLSGAFVDVVSTGASPVGAFVAPWGAADKPEPGWTWAGSGATLTYANKAAPAGESSLRVLTLKQGQRIKVDARRAGLRLAGGEGAVGVRVTIGRGTPGEIRYCSLFGPAEVARDEVGSYVARGASATALADCSDASLGTFADLEDAVPLTPAQCGPGFDGVGSSTAEGTDLHRVTLHGADEVCNDGSPAVFYIRRATPGGGHERDWLVWLEGGGNCGTPETCADRWCGTRSQPGYGAHKMSSRYTWTAIKGNGIFRQDPRNRFKDFHMVSTYYCSSDNYVGRDTIDVEPGAGYPGYRLHFNGQAILQGMLRALRDGVTSDDGDVTLPPLDASSTVLFTGSSGGGQGAVYNVNRVATWAAGIPVASFKVSIDSRVVPSVDDTTTLTAAQKEDTLRRGSVVAAFRNDILDEACVRWHVADPRYCTESSHLLLHHVTQTFFVNQDLEDPVVGPGSFATMADFTAAERTYLSTQFLQRNVVAEEAAVRAQPLPVVFAPRCGNHVGLESNAFYDNALRVPPAPFVAYNDTLGDWWSGTPQPSMIAGLGGAVTDLAHCYP